MFTIFLSGLIYSSLLIVVASGLILTLGALRLVNLAHGSLYMLAAYAAFSFFHLFPDTPLCFFLVLLMDFVLLAAVGALIEVVLFRRIYRSDHILQLVITFGLIWIAQDVVRGVWGVGLKAVPMPEFLQASITFIGYTISMYNLLIIVVALFVGFGLWFLLSKTKAGMIIRAITNDADMTDCLGIDVRKWRTLIMALGCGLAGVAGALVTPWGSLAIGMDWKVLMDLVIVIVIGGMGSFTGAIIGALILGQVNAFGILILPEFAIVFGFIVMAVVLLIRPQGLLGRPE
jgi:branched-subunit amino acid ABC-type transport system permease component